jgi:hypothetical protein
MKMTAMLTRPKKSILFAVLLALAGSSAAREVLTGYNGEFTDISAIRFDATAENHFKFSCTTFPRFTMTDRTIDVHISVEVGGANYNRPCELFVQFDLGKLAAGTWTLATHYTGAQTKTNRYTFLVDEAAKSCNADPTQRSEIYVVHPTKTAGELSRDLQDPERRAAWGNPIAVRPSQTLDHKPAYLVYEAPRNLLPISILLKLEGFGSVSYGAYACFSASIPDTIADMVEFYHPTLNHYFYTPSAQEIALIEGGSAGAGWIRTGEKFRVTVGRACPSFSFDPSYAPDLRPTFRFYGKPGKGPNSHFFTVNRGECHAVTQDAGWQYEGSTFYAAQPQADGTCLTFTRPLYRLYNNRAAQNDSNHRFTTKQSIVDEMVAKGWVNEGTAMCL